MNKTMKKESEINQINVVSSFTKGSIAEYIFSKGDKIIAIDEKSIKNVADFNKILENKKFCKLTILHSDGRKTTTSTIPIIYLEDVKFERENKTTIIKQNTKIKTLPLIIISLLIIVLLVLLILNKKNNKNEISQKQIIASENQNEDVIAKAFISETETLPKTTIELLEATLRDNTLSKSKAEEDTNSLEGQQRRRSSTNRSEIYFAYDESGKILNLRDTYLATVELNDGITFVSNSRNHEGDSSNTVSNTRTRRASNRITQNYDSVENTLNTITELKDTIIENIDISDLSEKLIGRIYFDYGSSLDSDNMELSIEKYLLIQKQSEEIKQYSSIVLGLNDLIKNIPEDKKDSAVFFVLGYADTTLFNAIPEISERSNKFNTELSLKRAETVKTILNGEDFGIDSTNIITQGLGYSKNIDAKSELWKYRRVDIVVSY